MRWANEHDRTVCATKTVYASRKEADLASWRIHAVNTAHPRQTPYICPACGRWHNASPHDEKRKRKSHGSPGGRGNRNIGRRRVNPKPIVHDDEMEYDE